MQKQIQALIKTANETIHLISNSTNLDTKMSLIKSLHTQLHQIDHLLANLPQDYKKNLFQYQTTLLKTQLQEQDQKTYKDFLMAQRISKMTENNLLPAHHGEKRIDIIGIQSLPKLVYNPQETPAQNLIQSIVWADIRESNLLIGKSEIERVAKQMENHREVQEQINKIIHEQEKEIDIITSNIKKANKNVKEAQTNILIANMYQGGDKVELYQKQQPLSLNSISLNTTPQNRIVLNPQHSPLNYAKLIIRSRLSSFGFAIKSFFTNLFGTQDHK